MDLSTSKDDSRAIEFVTWTDRKKGVVLSIFGYNDIIDNRDEAISHLMLDLEPNYTLEFYTGPESKDINSAHTSGKLFQVVIANTDSTTIHKAILDALKFLDEHSYEEFCEHYTKPADKI
ncbi:hypothetical protein GGF41_001824 [Coemansia sp. RSA 2531]|nr:hypothetical protein GGF41_001824 [Coemansia sp. RSA 2531]